MSGEPLLPEPLKVWIVLAFSRLVGLESKELIGGNGERLGELGEDWARWRSRVILIVRDGALAGVHALGKLDLRESLGLADGGEAFTEV